MTKWLYLVPALAAASACAAPAPPAVTQAPAPSPALQRANIDLGPPYLGGAPLPGGLLLVPPPPEAGSARQAVDDAVNARAVALAGSARRELAHADASLARDWFGDAFSCAAGVALSGEATPAIAHLVRRAAADFASSTGEVKEHYFRARPYLGNKAPTCTPDDEAFLAENGAYPSGHAAMGWGTGLVLASVFPGRAAELVSRGRAFGDSRAICNLHWASDVEAGRIMADATLARLMADAQFIADLRAAQDEVARVDAAPAPARCDAEARALAQG